jgi:tRNA-Thr(GGU) m(6)t(6)A37 methyltransferase TsaA
MKPVAYVHSERTEPIDDNWNSIPSYIELTNEYDEDSILGLRDFSHIEIIYYFHKADPLKIVTRAEHPRENLDWPKVGIFAQRKKTRPNLIGATIAKIEKIEGKRIYLASFDAIDGTPVLDIKPVFAEYLPETITQPEWVSELMERYW